MFGRFVVEWCSRRRDGVSNGVSSHLLERGIFDLGGWSETNQHFARVKPHPKQHVVGNDKVPTVLEFSVSRAQYLRRYSSAEQKDTIDYGLKLAWNRIIREESENGVKEATHVVAFRFNVADTIYVKEISMKLAILTRFGTVLTLLLTAMSSMKFVKVQLQRCIDHCIKTKARVKRRANY